MKQTELNQNSLQTALDLRKLIFDDIPNLIQLNTHIIMD